MSASNIQVAIKVRPILRKEKEQKQASNWKVAGNSIQLVDGQPEPFYFDHIFDQDVCNQHIFDTMAKQIVDSGLKGFNGTIFAYGQTSSGKTYTMMGDEQNPGVMVLATKEIFKEIDKATDRQFLLRVGYIEIYNEKIYDLLNKSNQDLKIHETPNGEVNVNCSEYIITCEQDLLSYLCLGSKQRKIGETNMNERSSRSHAIFPIIIESRKTDKTDDDSVQISILNLVDLAGSERADQTGATGSRLKEGGHINKSLLFLSCVIKQLAEDKYVSYRDSKLTRILQASLGGNALTAIICTINPTAVEETLSTLSFANRAKVVKNKPQVNEVLTDAAMMKRLEKEINRLQNELEVEKTKNSQIKVGQLQKRLNEEILKIINSNSSYTPNAVSEKRRRTWCPSSITPPLVEVNSGKTETFLLQPTTASQLPTKLQLPKSGMNFTPHITLRDEYYHHQLKEIQCSPSIEEEFIPAEDVCFDEMLTPRTSPLQLKVDFQTPKDALKLRTASLTPRLTEKERCELLESRIGEFENASQISTEQIARYEKEVNELKTKITQLEMENRDAVSLEFEYQQHKSKSKRRETELLDALEEKQKEINKLERALQSKTIEVPSNSKEGLQELSKSLIETDSVNVKCKDLQRLFTEYYQVTENFEKISSECQALQVNLEKVNLEAESAKLRADSLETENDSLKKDAEHLKSLNGTLEEVQNQIAALQAEKCKLESVKIEFQVMSKETANKIAEKVNISQEIQTLNTQRDTLAAECDKLLADIAANGCVREELNKLRTENDSLHSELQTIKKKLESAQSDYANLMTENQSKTDNYEKLNMEVLSARNQLQTLQSEYHDIQQKYEQIQAECNKHEGTIGEIQSEYDSIQNKYQSLQREYEKLENDSVQSIADCDRVQNQNENLETEIRELKTKVEEAQRKLLENESLQLELESLKSEMNRLQGEYDRNMSINSKSASPNKEEKYIDPLQENAKLKHEMEDLQQKFNEMQKEYDEISTQLVDNFADYETLQGEVATLEAELKQYKDSAVVNHLAEDFEAMKVKSEQLQTENCNLAKENAEWKQTLLSMTESMREKCDEREQLLAQLEESKNESARSESARKSVDSCEQFIQLAETFVEIEIPIGNGSSRTFQAVGAVKSAPGSRMIIGSVSGITQGMFNELRGAIEFAVSTDEHKSGNEIYDSLEMEDNSTGANSCDSLEGISRHKHEAQINELVEEKSCLFERIRDLKEEITSMKIENKELKGVRMLLDDTQRSVEQLNGEKISLITICDENKCKINELNEIISRAECDNKKLIADCEQLKKTVESEIDAESVSREVYEKLKQQHEGMCEKMHADQEKISESLKEYERTCAELRGQLLALQSTPATETILDKTKEHTAEFGNVKLEVVESECKCEEYKNEISKLTVELDIMAKQLKNSNENDEDADTPARAELEKTISELHEQLQTCKCPELQASLDEKTQQLDKTAKYEQDICVLLEQLKQQECECKEVQIEIIELKTSLEAKIQESKESATKYEDLNGRYAKLQVVNDELQSMLNSEKKKSAELEKMEAECSILQSSVACLSQTIASLGDDRNEVIRQKENLEKEYNLLSEKLLLLKDRHDSVKSLQDEVGESNQKLKLLEDENVVMTEEKQQLEQEKKEIQDKCEILKNSERSLHEQLQKLVQDHELILRDKERLERECHLSSSELEKLKEECETKSRENLDIQQKCKELEQMLNNVSSEKKALQCESEKIKEQHEELKESHQAERTSLEKKYSALMAELHVLATTKNELQLALEKAKKHSDFLLQQGKDLEEQFNLELCSVRNSNNSMAEQIDDLHEKLEKAEDELKIALGATSSWDEMSTKLKTNNESLTAKISGFEEKFVHLEQQLEESKQQLSEQVQVKENLEKCISEKDEMIAQLSSKHNSLTTKSSELEEKYAILERQLEESKHSLAAEMHLKEVLEKANTERDDLIVRLTNNNNSLASKSSELEEKLAILENQFAESKKHLTAEVGRLNQLLSEANHMTTTQSAKIEDLTSKLAAQNTTAERDSLLQKLNQLQVEYDNLTVEHANLELARSSFEAELNSARAVVVENTSLLQKTKELQSALDEIQLKCNSLCSANEKLQSANNAIAKQIGDTIQQAGEYKRLIEEITKLRADLEKTQEDVNKSKEEQKKNSSDWESKERSFVEEIAKLKADVNSLLSEKKSIQKKLKDAEETGLGRIAQLEQQIQSLQKDHSINLSKSISPKREKGMEHLMGEGHLLKVKNMCLMDKLDSCQKSQNEERKNRRLSTHDERRLQSFWDSNRDVSTMTDPTNTECSCSELDLKLNDIKQKLLIRDCQVNTLSMELKNHPLKTENATLKNLLIEEESKRQQLRQELKKCKQLITNKTNESRHCDKCAEVANRITVQSATQTTDSDESECYRKLLSKYEDLKMICRGRHTKIKELEGGKENANENFSSLHKQKYELLKKEFKIIHEKYEEAKLLCNMRYEQIQNLSSQLAGNS